MNERQQYFMKHFPADKELVQMEPEELAPFILKFLKGSGAGSGMLNKQNFGNAAPAGPVWECLMEAWAWLEKEGFICAKENNWVFITRKGRNVNEETDFTAYMQAAIFPSDLDPELMRVVRPMFLRG